MEINFKKISLIAGAIVAVLSVLSAGAGGSVWALEQHFDKRYLLIADSLQGKLLDTQKDIFLEEQKEEPDEAYLRFLELQEEQLKNELKLRE